MLPAVLNLQALRALYAGNVVTPLDMAEEVAARMVASNDPAIFITTMDRDSLRYQAEDLLARAPRSNSLPLWGAPFAVKDNIDVAAIPTTAACPAFVYTPDRDAFVVARLKAAGAIMIGKTNLDQFATGLNGTRSPYGAPRCVFDPAFISGGSSSGSAVAVAAGLAAFSLGTDTAGSGRVPAAFNNIVGIKPTPGRLSTSGLVPACRSLDCVSVFATTVADGVFVRRLIEGYDDQDPFSKVETPVTMKGRRVGVLQSQDRAFFGDSDAEALYDASVERLRTDGWTIVPFDYAPFRDVAALLYQGPWVAERLAALEPFHASHADAIEPSVRAILETVHRFSALDAFRGRYTLEDLRRRTMATWAKVDMLILPTAPTIYTVEAMLADPLRLNSNLGHYTNFANLLGLAAIAVPAGFRRDGLALGVTLVGPGWSDDALAPVADRLHRLAATGMGQDRTARLPQVGVADAENDRIPIVLVGAHMSGMTLNGEIASLGGILTRTARTSAHYRLFTLPDTEPTKPGLLCDPGFHGPGIEVEVWTLAPGDFARFVALIPAPLCIGRITLDDGSTPQGFLCEGHATTNADDITAYAGWRSYVASRPIN